MVEVSIGMEGDFGNLMAGFPRSGTMDCWEVAGIRVEQGDDGLVRVERLNRQELPIRVLVRIED